MSAPSIEANGASRKGSATAGGQAPVHAAHPVPNSAPLTLAQWLGFICLVMGNFLAILDIQVVASSLLDIQAGLSASSEDMAWVQSAYLIAEVVAIPLSGFLSRLLSTRNFFMMAAGGFTLMSLAAAFAWNIESMIFFRALQGFFGGGMIPTTMAAIFTLFPKERQMKAQVLVGLVSTMGPVIGPTLGGYLTALYSWHWLFLINILPGFAIVAGVWRFVNIDRGDWSLAKSIDYVGIVALACFLGALEYALEEGPRHSWFEDGRIVFAVALSVAGSIAFFWRSFTAPTPVVDLRSLANKNFALACLFTFCLGVVLYGTNFVTPLYLGTVRGFSSMQIGEQMAAAGVVMFVMAPVVGILSSKFPKRYIVAAGLAGLGYSSYLAAHLTEQWGFWELLPSQLLRGASLISCFIPLSALSMGTLPPPLIKGASALFNLMRNLGGAFGLAYLNTLLTTRQAYHWQQLIPAVTAGRMETDQALAATTQAYQALGNPAPDTAALEALAQRIKLQASVLTFNDLFLVMAILATVVLLAVPLLKEASAHADGVH